MALDKSFVTIKYWLYSNKYWLCGSRQNKKTSWPVVPVNWSYFVCFLLVRAISTLGRAYTARSSVGSGPVCIRSGSSHDLYRVQGLSITCLQIRGIGSVHYLSLSCPKLALFSEVGETECCWWLIFAALSGGYQNQHDYSYDIWEDLVNWSWNEVKVQIQIKYC